jgi:hypothetical protein
MLAIWLISLLSVIFQGIGVQDVQRRDVGQQRRGLRRRGKGLAAVTPCYR